eukprot:scaffold5038_cov112-Isochrysis_galbana.AAC.3
MEMSHNRMVWSPDAVTSFPSSGEKQKSKMALWWARQEPGRLPAVGGGEGERRASGRPRGGGGGKGACQKRPRAPRILGAGRAALTWLIPGRLGGVDQAEPPLLVRHSEQVVAADPRAIPRAEGRHPVPVLVSEVVLVGRGVAGQLGQQRRGRDCGRAEQAGGLTGQQEQRARGQAWRVSTGTHCVQAQTRG